MNKILRTLAYLALVGTSLLTSCNDEDETVRIDTGTITGVVSDNAGQPVPDVSVVVSGVDEEDVTVTTASDGTYTVEKVSLKLHAVTFSKSGWLTLSKSVSAQDFGVEKRATVDVTLVNASAKIAGTVTDAKNGGAPLADVTITVGVAGTVQSGSDGTYAIENLVADNYTVTFTKANYVTITKQVAVANFAGGIESINVAMGSQEVLRGLSADDLSTADKWYYIAPCTVSVYVVIPVA